MEIHLHRYRRPHGCSLFIAIDSQTAPKLFHPLTHSADANTVSSVACLHHHLARMPLAPVAHRQLEPVRFSMQRNLCHWTSRVAQHIRESFLHDAEDCNLYLV